MSHGTKSVVILDTVGCHKGNLCCRHWRQSWPLSTFNKGCVSTDYTYWIACHTQRWSLWYRHKVRVLTTCKLLVIDSVQLKQRVPNWQRRTQNGADHYSDVIMGAIAFSITSPTIVYSTVYSDADQRKHQSSASLAFVRGIHRWPLKSPHKWPVTLKMFPFDDVIMEYSISACCIAFRKNQSYVYGMWKYIVHGTDIFLWGETSLQWRHNWRDGVSNHQPHDCLLNRLFRRR